MISINASTKLTFAALIFGVVTGYNDTALITSTAHAIATALTNILKLISMPMLFLSIITTLCSMDSVEQVKTVGFKTLKYTLLTTVIAAFLALTLFLLINPVQKQLITSTIPATTHSGSYLATLLGIIPTNIVEPFMTHNVMSILFLALLISFAIIPLADHEKEPLKKGFNGLFAAIIKITEWLITIMPLGVWAFIHLFLISLRESNYEYLDNIALYLLTVLLANIIQGSVILPLLLKMKGISPLATFKGVTPALTVAFFSRSSTGALPLTIKSTEHNLGVSSKIARFTLPLCSTINMNGCAAFILITVLFVAMSNGYTYSLADMIAFVFIATIAAIGNASVPMGCYFLASAFLSTMNIPLFLMGVILPLYTIIDMVETALNVWSDVCVACIVNQELHES